MSNPSKYYQSRRIWQQVTNFWDPILHKSESGAWWLKIWHWNDRDLLPNLSKLMEFGVIVQNDELHKILFISGNFI